jgi:hypothetical protein
MEAFRHHHIFPDGRHFTDESLCWEEPPKKDGKPLEIPELSYEQTAFFGNPGQLMALEQAAVQACAVAEAMTANEDWRAFLRISPERPLEIIGIRSFARPGPNGLTEFGTVVEIIGRRTDDRDRSGFLAGSGACLVFDSLGALSSCAQLGNEESDVLQRSDRAERYCVSRQGQKSWVRTANGEWMLHENLFRRLCMR